MCIVKSVSARGCAIFLLLSGAVQAQNSVDPAAQRMPAGLHINSVEMYGTGYLLEYPNIAGTQRVPSLWLATAGTELDLSLDRHDRRSDFAVHYIGGYSANARFHALNGADHALTLSIRRQITPRVAFRMEGSGDSRIMYGALFRSPAAAFADGLTAADSPGILPESGAYPIEIGLAGARRTSGSLRAGFSYSQSPRLQWSGDVSANRVLRAHSSDAAFAAHYPSVTVGEAILRSTYSVTRRTRLGGSVEVSRSYTPLYRLFWQFAGMRLERELGRRSFVHLDGGYQRMSGTGTSNSQHSYSAAGGFGTRKGNHTLSLSGRRGIANLYGMPVSSTMSYLGAWSWGAPASAWRVGASYSYEQLRPWGAPAVDAAVYQMNLVRRLSAHFRFGMEGAYVANRSMDASRSGIRLSWIWESGRPGRI